MNKQTLLFAAAVFSTLFFVNLYFNSQYEQELQRWNASQEAKKEARTCPFKQRNL